MYYMHSIYTCKHSGLMMTYSSLITVVKLSRLIYFLKIPQFSQQAGNIPAVLVNQIYDTRLPYIQLRSRPHRSISTLVQTLRARLFPFELRQKT